METTDSKTDEAIKHDPQTGEILQPQANVPVPVQGGALSTDQLAKLRRNAGKQTFTVKELLIPQFKIVSNQTGYRKRASPDFLPAAEEGDLIDTLTLRLRKGPVSFLPVRFATTYIETKGNTTAVAKIWGTDSSGYDAAKGGDVGRRVTADGNQIAASAAYHIIILDEDGSSMPAMMYVGSTSWKEARRLNTLIGGFELMSEEGPFIAPPYARVYTANTVPMANDEFNWFGWKFGVGELTLSRKYGDALYEKAVKFEEAIERGEIKVHGPVEDEREMMGAGQGTRQPREQGVGPNRGEEPPAEAYAEEMGERARTQSF